MPALQVPMVQVQYYNDNQRSQIKKKIDFLEAKYRKEINQASSLCNVPKEVILSFMFIENSSGNPKLISSAKAIGLMQVKPETISDMIYLENKTGNLTKGEKDFIRKHIGSRLDCILAMKYMGHKLPCNQNKGFSITSEDLMNPEFNIFAGTLYLSILLRLHTENGIIRMDKVVVRYNRGYFSKAEGTTQQLIATSPKETRDYIAKAVGVNSPLDILTV